MVLGHFGMERCSKNWKVLIGTPKNRMCCQIKSFDLFSKFANFWPLTKKKLKVSPIFPIFDFNFSNRDLLMIFNTFCFWQNFMAVDSCDQQLLPPWDGRLANSHSFLVKTHKNWIFCKISIASFLPKFSHNNHIADVIMEKNNIWRNFKFWPPQTNPDPPLFPILDQYFLLWIS